MKSLLRIGLAGALPAMLCLCLVGAGAQGPAERLRRDQSMPACVPAPNLISGIYQQLLERVADAETTRAAEAQLAQGQKTVRDLVRELALSDEFRRRFLEGRPAEESVRLVYQHLLARGASADELRRGAESVRTAGFAALINVLIDGPEYAREFGDRSVPARPVALSACRFPITLRREETVGPGQSMSTEVSVTENGQLSLTTRTEFQAAAGGFCGRVALWLLDEHDNVLEITGPAREQAWCVRARGPNENRRTDEWQGAVTADKLQQAAAIAILHTSSGGDPADPTRENTTRARQVKQSLH